MTALVRPRKDSRGGASPAAPREADIAVFGRFQPSGTLLAGAILVAVTIAVYANGLSGSFVFDDLAAIVSNPSIRTLGDLGAALSPPHGSGATVEGRPILNLSFAINYAIGGTTVWSYHLLNVLIHAAAALVLFGIVRRSVCRPLAAAGSRAPSLAAAFLAALLWAVHPLQTESVTYIAQRAESLMGLFYLLTLYCFIRAVGEGKSSSVPGGVWLGLSWLACLLGMATKEVMVSAPLIVLLYDGVFVVKGAWTGVLRRRWRYYTALFSTEGILIALAARAGTRGGMSGFGIGVSPAGYWAAQFQAVAHYLRLSFWPRTLIFDYGVQEVKGAAAIVPCALLVLALATAAAAALWRRHPAGFLGACFFAILAPTSLVPGARQTLAEHRMYLPLAVVIAGVVCGAGALAPGSRRRAGRIAACLLGLAAAAALSILTVRRNEIYRSELALDADTVAKRPGNVSAHDNLGNRLRDAGRYDEAIAQYEAALRLRPDYYRAQYNWGIALADSGRVQAAIPHYREALRMRPDYPEARNNLGIAFSRLGRDREAIGQLVEAVRLRPAYVEAHYNLGLALARAGRMQEAADEFERTLNLAPDFGAARVALGYARRILGRAP